MVFDDYTKQRILIFFFQGSRPPTIARLLESEGIVVSRRGVATFLKRYMATRTIAQRPGSGGKTKITDEIKQVVEEQMKLDDNCIFISACADTLGAIMYRFIVA